MDAPMVVAVVGSVVVDIAVLVVGFPLSNSLGSLADILSNN